MLAQDREVRFCIHGYLTCRAFREEVPSLRRGSKREVPHYPTVAVSPQAAYLHVVKKYYFSVYTCQEANTTIILCGRGVILSKKGFPIEFFIHEFCRCFLKRLTAVPSCLIAFFTELQILIPPFGTIAISPKPYNLYTSSTFWTWNWWNIPTSINILGTSTL
jgi:hypothetical protein